MLLSELARHVAANPTSGEDPEITDITFDSREVAHGSLFVAMSGFTHDGHNFVRRAVSAGAAAIVVDEARASQFGDLDVPLIKVADTRAALGSMAASFFGRPADALQVVGITGTNGKTTVSYLIEAALGATKQVGVLGTVNYRWAHTILPAANTTPESLVVQRLLRRMHDDGVDVVAMEVSSHGLATHRLNGTTFDVAVFTNLSQDHLDFHKTWSHYRDAKRSLFTQYLKSSGLAVINVDDEEGVALAEIMRARGTHVVTTSARADAHADLRCRSFEQSVGGSTMTTDGVIQQTLQTRLLGAFNVSNVLQTLAVCHAINVPANDVASALRNVRGVPGRLQHLGGDGKPNVFVDYAHTPDALARALDALRPVAQARLVVVFGCGGDRDADKRAKMGVVATQRADTVVLTSDNPRSEDPAAIIAQIVQGAGANASIVEDRADAIAQTIAQAGREDVILVAGKGHETYQEIKGQRVPFDDVEHVRRALERH